MAQARPAREPGPLRGGCKAQTESRAGRSPRALVRANLEELPPQFAQRHSLSGAFSTPALAPAGAVERRRGLPQPLSPLFLSSGGQSAGRPGRGRARLGGTPRRGPGLRTPAFQGWFGDFTGCLFQMWGGLSRYGSSVLLQLLLVTQGSGTPRHPVRSRPCLPASSQLQPVAQLGIRVRVRGPRVPRMPGHWHCSTKSLRAPTLSLGASVCSTWSPTTCLAVWVLVFRLLAPTESELLWGSVNETCREEIILWLLKNRTERGRGRPGDAARARAAQTG